MAEKTLSVTVNRDDFISMMRNIRNNFVDNNEISTIMVEYLPLVDEIIINQIRNDQLDVPFIRMHMVTRKFKTLKISRNHKVIWSILDQLFIDQLIKSE